jgi:hypothetical protein
MQGLTVTIITDRLYRTKRKQKGEPEAASLPLQDFPVPSDSPLFFIPDCLHNIQVVYFYVVTVQGDSPGLF